MNKYIFLLFFFVFLQITVFAESHNFKTAKSLELFFSVLRELDMHYVDTIDSEKLVHTALEKMLASLDPYTVIIPHSESSDFDLATTGKYGGVGAVIQTRNDEIRVVEVYEGFPADIAGLRPGNKILFVDSIKVNKLSVDKVSDVLKGKIGSNLDIQFVDNQNDTIKKTLTRANVYLPSVPFYGRIDKVGYIYFSSFTQDCSQDVKMAILDLKKQGVEGIILDLRNNTGGLLNEAVKVVNFFIPKGQNFLSVKGKVGGEVRYKTTTTAIDIEIPLVILINQHSASSSEILAGAFQDLDRAIILGQRSFGKGLVQTVRPLAFNEQFKLTTAKYYTPSGRCVQALDYKHKNDKGVASRTVDSLAKKFTTRAGRTVLDAGGIIPDIVITPEKTPHVLQKLYSEYLFFDFATYYHTNNINTIFNAKKFLQDFDFQEFIRFVKQINFTYETTSSAVIQELIKTFQKEKYYEMAQKQIDSLQILVKPNIDEDLMRFKPEILKILAEEIAGRYGYQKAKIEVLVQQDKEVRQAIDILNNPKKYKELLGIK
ncbi:MAG: S41 family peptidase [Bacteroidales bacterium]